MQVTVRDNNVDQAMRVLKRKLLREGVFRDMRSKEAFESKGEKKRRRKKEAIARIRRQERKRQRREGLL